MIKIINPCMCETYRGNSPAYAKITYADGKLSICGVIGPLSNGNCKGSAGQCVDEIRAGNPAKNWTNGMLQKFCDIWDEWHLNDMRPYCKHQKELGWDELEKKEVPIYHFRLRHDVIRKQSGIKDDALERLKKSGTVRLDLEDRILLYLPYSLESETESLRDRLDDYYEPKKPIYSGDVGAKEIKRLGWLSQKEHSEGILSKPCPICGYKYGSSWLKEEVPQDVIDWLFSLPDTEREPAWV